MPKAGCFGCGSLPERQIRVLLTSFRSSTLPSNTSLQDSSVATRTRQRLIILLGESEGFRASGGPERFDRIDVEKSAYHHQSLIIPTLADVERKACQWHLHSLTQWLRSASERASTALTSQSALGPSAHCAPFFLISM